MTGREKTLAALTRDGSSEIAAGICYDSIYIRDCWERLTHLPWWHRIVNDPELLKTAYGDVYRSLDYDWIMTNVDVDDRQAERFIIIEQAGKAYCKCRVTGELTELIRPPAGGADMSGQLFCRADAPNDLEAAETYFGTLLGLAKAQRVKKRAVPTFLQTEFPNRCPMGYAQSPFQRCFPLWGFNQTMMMAYDNPNLLLYASKRFLELECNSLRTEAARGAEVIWIEECYCEMVNREHYRTLCFPYVRALCEEIRALGMKSVYYFTGNPWNKWDMLLDSKADMLGFEESKKGIALNIMDLASATKGQCALLGNLDAINLLPRCTKYELAEALREQVRAAKLMKGRFIFSLGSPLTPDTSLTRVKEYVDLARKLGRL